MALAYVAAGINHFVHPDFYLPMMPKWLPYHAALVAISGVAEILLGLLLIPKGTRALAGWGLIVLLISVFPANVQMMLNQFQSHHPTRWISVLRLPLQGVLIYWAYLATTKPNMVQAAV